MKFNVLNSEIYLFSRSLENLLLYDVRPIDKNCKYPKGVYLVKLKKLSSDNTIIFSYMYYNPLLTDCILAYLGYRFVDVNLLRNEINDVVVLIDNSLKLSLLSNKYESNIFAFNEPVITNLINNIDEKVSLFDLYIFLRKLNLYMNVNDILNLMSLDINSKYYDIIYTIYKQYDSFINYSNYIKEEDKKCWSMDNTYNLIDNSLIVCSDLTELLNKFNILNLTINQGPQSRRGEVSFINNYLSHLDIDFRNALFYHYRHHYNNNNKTNYGMPIIPKGKFSFRNIHMKLGTVRWFNSTSIFKNVYISKKAYSTNIVENFDVVSNRQMLFQENYSIIKNMIDNNSGSLTDLQKNIEYFLNNQEFKFSEKKKLSTDFLGLKHNDESFDFIKTKKKDILELISKENFTKISKRDKRLDQKVWISKFLEEMNADYISDLLLGFFFEILIKENTIVDDIVTPGIPTLIAFEKFGEKLVSKYLYDKYMRSVYKKRDDISFSLYKHYNKSKFKIFEEDTFNSIVGGHFVGALIEVELIYQELDVKVGTFKEKEYYLRIDNSVRKILLKHNNMFLHIPPKLPMVCEPKDFVYSQEPENNKLGGYLLNDVLHTDHIFKNKRGYGVTTKLEKDNTVVSLVNGFSKTPYKINSDTLDFIKLYGLDKNIIIDDSEPKIQRFLRNPYDNNYNKSDRDKLRPIYSKIVLEKNILNIANCYVGANKIYFPVRLDQRTRVYCETDYFDYQKNDLAKGLISFAEPGLITKLDNSAIKFFKGFGASMYGDGLDKKSLNSKVKWVDDNSDYILNFRSNDIINKAENRTCFVSFCFEYERFIDFYNSEDKTVFYSYLPIQLDASCNGYQHLALLTRETKIFNNLNLGRSTHDDIPDDFYKYIIEENMKYMLEKQKTLSNLNNKSSIDINLLDSINRLIEVSFDRSLVKKIIMTKSYNASIIRLVEHLAKNLDNHKEDIINTTDLNNNKKTKTLIYYTYKNHNVKLIRKDLLNFVMSLKIVLDKISPKIKLLTEYLDNVVKICTKLNTPVPWALPSGAMIKESYQKVEEEKVKAFSFLKGRYTFKKYLDNEFSYKKQKRATMPNLIHSLDGTTIAILFEDFNKIGSLYTVHDCFATTADCVPYLINNLKSVYIKLYSSNDYLVKFDSFVKNNLNKSFGDAVYTLNDTVINIPKKNKIEIVLFPDINKVLDIKGNELDKVNNLIYSAYPIM